MSIFDDIEEDDENQGSDAADLLPFDVEDDDNPTHFTDDDDYTFDGMAQLDTFEDDDEDQSTNTTQSTNDNDLINDILTTKGIVDHTIHYEDEDGNIVDEDFYSLTRKEQLAILNSSDRDINYDLEDAEVDAINFLRESGVSLEEAIDHFKREAVQEFIDSQNIAGIEVDQYSDEQLFALDLKAKYEDLTDDEIAIEIEKQLEHPDLFKKKVDKLRTDYKEIEKSQLEDARLRQEGEEEQRFAELQENLVTVAQSVEDIGGLDLDNNDKNEVLSYILDKDINGVSPFIKSLDSPEKLFELAWFATKGKEAFGIIHDYYKKQIDSVRKTSYERGKEEATKKPTAQQSNRKTYVRDNPTPNKGQSKLKHIDDFDLEIAD